MKSPSRREWAIALSLLIVAALGFFAFHIRLPPDAIIMLPMPAVAQPPTWRERMVESSPAWVWRLKLALLGPDKEMDLDATIFEIESAGTVSSLSLGTPQFTSSNAVTGWVLPAQVLKPLRDRLKQLPQDATLFHPRLTASDGVQAVLDLTDSVPAAGSPLVIGLRFSCAPHCEGHTIDLKTALCLTEAVTNQNSTTTHVSLITNFAFAARLQFPDRGCIFLLSPAVRNGHEISIGTLVSGSIR